MFLYGAVSSPLDRSERFTLHPPGRPVHSDTNSTSLGRILATQPSSPKTRASDFPFQKKQFSVSKKVKFRFDSVSLLATLNSMKSQYIERKCGGTISAVN